MKTLLSAVAIALIVAGITILAGVAMRRGSNSDAPSPRERAASMSDNLGESP